MSKFQRFSFLALLLCLFGIVWGSRLWMVNSFGSDMPNWDQWDGEGLAMYIPYFQDQLRFTDLFTPHNEHRIFFSKITDLGLLILSGQWDAQLECTFNALLWSIFATVTFVAGKRFVGVVFQPLFFLGCVATFGLPIAWQNILGGFHSAQCFLVGFSAVAIWFSILPQAGSAKWWLGCIFAMLANFTMGSGVLAAAAIMAISAARFARQPTNWREIWPTLLATVITIAVGALMRVPTPDGSKAQSVYEFCLTLCRCMQWPNRGFGSPLPNDRGLWIILVIHAPIILLTWRWWRKPERTDRGDDALLCLGLWTLLQAAAVAYARGAGGQWPAPRYLDTFMFGLLVNGVVLIRLYKQPLRGLDWRNLGLPTLSIVWLTIIIQGLWPHLAIVIGQEMPDQGTWLRAGEKNVRSYLATRDATHLDSHDIPYPNGHDLRLRLDHPEIIAILPQSIRRAQLLSFPQTSTVVQNTALTSNPFTPAYDGYLKFPITNPSDVSGIQILDAQTRITITPERPTVLKEIDGYAAYFRAPNRPLMISFQTDIAAKVQEISRPVDVSRLSFYSMVLVHAGRVIAVSGAFAAVILLALNVIDFCKGRHFTRNRPDSPITIPSKLLR